ncbi:hypothetical protein LX15_002645 [Streptoalloteichus tenebrarius]|uniref:Secreted protein n=1 Tax=Streptoalloteichus tenebrarius (strain ATCC 17920 / DSM 40477 / JCM 4838 / CBS 697.72 / NBRC 16177 / NCIMB 11028 / NRRL B-12390 / A12253. 1 / ISP 5477) TaxID=1933 RepID=A0ABT1HTU1_STRSD|nr:hypothetical protein [Streptoalloteichus tenebrarius]MCP2258946.1 hypothetical protein [Streptoalloteichus tenebrarius]BFF01155.1 hypothetical protein GCM10020241_28300 [Streptoalloteichus tenebrarius]
MTAWSGPLPGHDGFAETVAVVAQPTPAPKPNDPGGRGEDFGKSSPVGLLLLILFFVAVVFLVRSMTKHLRRLPASFDKPADGGTGDDATETSSASETSEASEASELSKTSEASPAGDASAKGRKNNTGHTAKA